MVNEIVVQNEKSVTMLSQNSIFLSMERFEFAKRVAAMLAASNMVPTHFQGTNGVGNCMIALNLAERLNVDVFGLMQTSYVVHGKPGFEAKLLIALFSANTKLFFPPLRWETEGDFPHGSDAKCRAYARDRETGENLYGEWIDIAMIKGEGWEKNSKWTTMPGQMFRYRAASFFINAYEPGLKLGIMTVDEIEDSEMINVTPMQQQITSLIETPTAKIHKAHEAKEKAKAKRGPAAEEEIKAPDDPGPDPRQDNKKGFDYLKRMSDLKALIKAVDGNHDAYYQALDVYNDSQHSTQVPEEKRAEIIMDLEKYIAGRKVDGPLVE